MSDNTNMWNESSIRNVSFVERPQWTVLVSAIPELFIYTLPITGPLFCFVYMILKSIYIGVIDRFCSHMLKANHSNDSVNNVNSRYDQSHENVSKFDTLNTSNNNRSNRLHARRSSVMATSATSATNIASLELDPPLNPCFSNKPFVETKRIDKYGNEYEVPDEDEDIFDNYNSMPRSSFL
jgi:hypothetical protein